MIKAKFLGLAATVSIMLLGACTDPNTSGGTDPNRNTKTGAIVGGIAGAIIGSATAGDDGDERRRGAIIGGLAGAGGGALIGRQLDKQAAELRNDLNNNIDVVNTGERLIVTMPQDLLFAVDSTRVRPDLRSDLFVLSRSLNDYPDSSVIIIGHTDNTGPAGYNQDLSERRARSVGSVLTEGGVSQRRLRTIGRGEEQPVASNLTPEGRAQNRRVEIVIQPNT
ncbi:OmpA family protein [Parasulfitobacter algicola]|uniref:OmpA family protein n=1 Tax=Parasulfitobacter algicola TaxID=2614809 RepID=A0ABX2IMP2_9RHOB|nr:OmpA family protein [Sulfitobacter algicola]NSX53246.1 OmpA family protein [Sulfitobacter algicola]